MKITKREEIEISERSLDNLHEFFFFNIGLSLIDIVYFVSWSVPAIRISWSRLPCLQNQSYQIMRPPTKGGGGDDRRKKLINVQSEKDCALGRMLAIYSHFSRNVCPEVSLFNHRDDDIQIKALVAMISSLKAISESTRWLFLVEFNIEWRNIRICTVVEMTLRSIVSIGF